jgi:hypothetical protein
MKYLFLIFTITFQGQVLHHQMLSSQGLSKKMSDGSIIRQTIGQQSVTGNSNKNYIVMQGFQLGVWGKKSTSNSSDDIKTITYPNPFVGTLNFTFSKPITENIEVYAYDIGGHLILRQTRKLENNILTIIMPEIPEGEYFIRLIAKEYNYTGKILKVK